MNRLDQKVAVISGGARGMGAETATRFLAEGAAVVVGDLLIEEGKQLSASVGSERFVFAEHDVTDPAGWRALVDLAVSSFGGVDILVNNAAVIDHTMLADLPKATFARVLEVDLIGPLLGIQAVLEPMRRAGGGSVINVTSTTSLVGMPQNTAYGSAKWGLRGLTKHAALELGGDGIRVNAVSPGPTYTIRNVGKVTDDVLNTLAIKRWGQPTDIASMCLFLASDEASFITGADFAVDGGMSAGVFIPDLGATGKSAGAQ
jgi:3alpha(or 20beta)-hydroxysteroid dehydrogenase